MISSFGVLGPWCLGPQRQPGAETMRLELGCQAVGRVGHGDIREINSHRRRTVRLERSRYRKRKISLAVLDWEVTGGRDGFLVVGLWMISTVVNAQSGGCQLHMNLSFVTQTRLLTGDGQRVPRLSDVESGF